MTNIIRDQKGGTCTLFSIANAIEQTLGVFIPDEDIYKFYEQYDDEMREGMSTRDVLEILKYQPLRGVIVKNYSTIYHVYQKATKDEYLAKLRDAMVRTKQGIAVLVAFRIRAGEGAGIPLNEKFELVPRSDEAIKDFHAVLGHDFYFGENRKNLGIRIENSHGEDFGAHGFFNMTWDVMETEIHEILAVKFGRV